MTCILGGLCLSQLSTDKRGLNYRYKSTLQTNYPYRLLLEAKSNVWSTTKGTNFKYLVMRPRTHISARVPTMVNKIVGVDSYEKSRESIDSIGHKCDVCYCVAMYSCKTHNSMLP